MISKRNVNSSEPSNLASSLSLKRDQAKAQNEGRLDIFQGHRTFAELLDFARSTAALVLAAAEHHSTLFEMRKNRATRRFKLHLHPSEALACSKLHKSPKICAFPNHTLNDVTLLELVYKLAE